MIFNLAIIDISLQTKLIIFKFSQFENLNAMRFRWLIRNYLKLDVKKSNKDILGFQMLSMLSQVDGDFTAEEGRIIVDYIIWMQLWMNLA